MSCIPKVTGRVVHVPRHTKPSSNGVCMDKSNHTSSDETIHSDAITGAFGEAQNKLLGGGKNG